VLAALLLDEAADPIQDATKEDVDEAKAPTAPRGDVAVVAVADEEAF